MPQETAKNNTAILLIHGILSSSKHFDFLLPHIPADLPCHDLLLDGHGGTVDDFSHTSMKKWKAQVSLTVQQLLEVYDDLIIVAHSMGTLFAIREAIDHPDKIRHLFLLQVPLHPWLKAKYGLFAVLMPFGIIPAAAQPMYDDCSVKLTRKLWKYILWLPRFLELFAESYATGKILHQLRVPCSVFQSKQDEVVSLRSHRDLQKHPHYQLTLLENSGHYCYSPEDTALLLEAFAKIAADH